MLDDMISRLKKAGYVPNKSEVLFDMDEEDKETALNLHSEKLAVAFGLISTVPGVPIRIVKNLRVCNDCHTATKLVSKLYNRELIVRDRNRFHHFTNGSCSCGDFWSFMTVIYPLLRGFHIFHPFDNYSNTYLVFFVVLHFTQSSTFLFLK